MVVCRSTHSFEEKRNELLGSIGFVPTMGGLHEGHLSLIEKAKKENDHCVVSVYLNETQFDDLRDLENYPSNIETDLETLKQQKVDLVFLPDFQQLYPDNYTYRVTETEVSHDLCGKSRPGHFDGVLTVVLKLLNIVRPTRAYFGEKDHQQLTLIEGLVKSFFLPVQIVRGPTVRDSMGLALSSRNKKLDDTQLKKAQFFAKTLQSHLPLNDIETLLKQENIEIDYLVEKNQRRYAAVKIGEVRLIDNVAI